MLFPWAYNYGLIITPFIYVNKFQCLSLAINLMRPISLQGFDFDFDFFHLCDDDDFDKKG